MTHKHDIIVIGASAGGVEALVQLVQALPADFPAAIFVVLHVAEGGASILPEILSMKGTLPAYHPQSGDVIENGRIYIAPNDYHLLVEEGHVILSRDPRENRFRPSIDTLFRTAASVYGAQVVGVILTGMLDNGSAGLVAVKQHGGTAVIQDPSDALFPDMPENALKVVEADYVLPLADIPALLHTLVATEVSVVPARVIPNSTTVTQLICPDCGGVLLEHHQDNLINFECRVGHRFSLQSMLAAQNSAVEASLWAAVRSLEENRSLYLRMEQHARDRNHTRTAEQYAARAQDTNRHADVIRGILLGTTT
jgi:two-component system chemotaxis response regulator CheB